MRKMLNTSEPFPGWSSGREREVMFLTLTWEEIRERYKISNWVDDVDNNLNVPIKVGYFADDKIGPVVLVQYFHYADFTRNWVEVIIDANQNVELATSRLIETLSLQEGDILGVLRSSDFIDLQE
jgi:hypothetical protein